MPQVLEGIPTDTPRPVVAKMDLEITWTAPLRGRFPLTVTPTLMVPGNMHPTIDRTHRAGTGCMHSGGRL